MKFYCLFIAIVLSSFVMRAETITLSELLPQTPVKWEISGEIKKYNQNTLYDYIDGGAELYNSYGMIEVISKRIVYDEDTEIRIEIFDMGEAKNAFGVFTHTRTKNENEFGQGSQYFTGSQIFWKDRFFVSVVANDENDLIVKTIKSLSSAIDKKITQNGNLPPIISALPQDDLLEDGFVYFHHYIWLNSYYFISNDNFLIINDETDAVLAKYGQPEARYYLLVIDYPDKELLQQAENNFHRYFMESTNETVQIEDNTWTGAVRIGNRLACAFNCTIEEQAKQLLSKVQNSDY